MVTKFPTVSKISHCEYDYMSFSTYNRYINQYKFKGLKVSSDFPSTRIRPFKFLISNIYSRDNKKDLFRFVNNPFKFSELFYVDRNNNLCGLMKPYRCKQPILKLNKLSLDMAYANISLIDRRDEINYEDEESYEIF